jgi:hypothetical protein
MDKSLIIVIDSFSDRVISNPNVTLFDYGKMEKVAYIDNYYNVYNGTYSGYGNYDDIILTEDYGFGFYQVSKDDILYSNTSDLDFIDRTSFMDRFGFTAYADNFFRFVRTDQTSETSPNHGDWVVEAILQTLDSPQYTEILCIDVDTLNGEFSHFDNVFDQTVVYFNGMVGTGSYLEQILGAFLNARDSRYSSSGVANYALGGISISIAGGIPDINEALFLNFLETAKIPIFQAAPNVNQGYFDYAVFFPNVITVGAWNKTSSNNLLLGSDSTIYTIDIVADGFVEKAGWGANFGTSFATPKVAAEFLNILNSAIISLNNSGKDLTDIENPDIEGIVYSNLVKSIVDAISIDGVATINGETVTDIKILTSTVEKNGFMPRTISGTTGSNLIITSAAADIQQTNRAPTGSVSMTGTPTQGQTLTAANTLADADGIPTSGSGAIAYQWRADGVAISGATGSTLNLTQSLVGKALSVRASYTDNLGTLESVTSSATTAVANVNDAPTGTVTITGTATQGQTLTAANTLADADGIPTSGSGAIAYQWRADGAAISGATGSTLVLTQAQVGKAVTVAARYTDNFGTLESVTSSATAAVANANDAPTGSVTISGTPTQGQTLTAANTLSDADGIPTSGSGAIAYQWSAGGVAISGATGSTLVLTQAQVGKSITVAARYTDNFGTLESVNSGTTTAVANVNDAPTGSVTISGTATRGQTLTAANTLADVDGIPTSGSGAISYQWRADGAPISGATNSSFLLTQAQVGKAVSVTASYTDSGGTTESVTSSATAAVTNVNIAPTGTVTITGTPTQGQTLTAANALTDPDGIPTSGAGAIAYQWSAGGVAISGATGSTLNLTQSLVGKALTVRASYTDNFGQAESVTSSATSAVSNVNDAPTGAVSISGNASQRHSLLATNTLADVDGIPGSGAAAISYQWRANGAPISGATGSTFSPTPPQIGKVITVTASYTDLGGAVESITSPATEPIRGFREFWHDAVTRGMERPNPQALPFGQDLLMADTSYSSDLARLFGVPLEFGS